MASEESLIVNLPEGLDDTGKWKTVPVNLSCARASELQLLVKEYRLRASARNKTGYTQCLLDFSRNEKEWDDIMRIPVQTPHKGPRTPKKKSSGTPTTPGSPSPVERSDIRKIRGLPSLPTNLGITGTLEIGTDQGRHVHYGEQLLSWASRLVAEEEKTQLKQGRSQPSAFPPSAVRSTPQEGMAMDNGCEVHRPLDGPSLSLAPPLIAELMKAATLINTALASMPQKPAVVGDIVADSYISSDPPMQSHQRLESFAVRSSLEHPNQSSPSHEEQEPTVSLYMRDHTISFTENDIPPPPPLPWKTSVDTLNALWDDDPSTWNHSSPLLIKGISIPLVYWQMLYKNRRSGHWESLKKRWSEWKYLVHEYRRLKPDGFWSTHSTDGLRHSTSRILATLRLQRAHADSVLTRKIKNDLKDKFSDVYSYSNGRHTMTTSGGVARRYRRTQEAIKQGVRNGA